MVKDDRTSSFKNQHWVFGKFTACGAPHSSACGAIHVVPSVMEGVSGDLHPHWVSGISDVDECVSPQHVCPRGTVCINTGGGFQCVSPECPEGSGNVSYVKTSPL